MLLSSGYGAGVYGHVPLPRVAVNRLLRVCSTVGASGGGGLARRATAASTAGVVLVVAATTAVVAVFVVVFVPVATVAATGRVGQRGGRWLGRRGRIVGVEHRRGSRRTRTIHVDILQ
jgi:hypothetical protein